MAKAIIGNKYRHFKGNVYEVLDIVTDTETMRERVIYKSLIDGKVWDRDREEWEGFAREGVERLTDIMDELREMDLNLIPTKYLRAEIESRKTKRVTEITIQLRALFDELQDLGVVIADMTDRNYKYNNDLGYEHKTDTLLINFKEVVR